MIKFTYKNGILYQILDDSISPYDRIVVINGEIFLMRDRESSPFWTISDLKNQISNIIKSSWRSAQNPGFTYPSSEKRRIKTLNYYKKIESIMVFYKREIKINNLLTKENYYDMLCLAC
jgi:hypothetical protein